MALVKAQNDAVAKAQRVRLAGDAKHVSDFNGVSHVRPRPGGEQWRSSLTVNGTTHYLGCFKDELHPITIR